MTNYRKEFAMFSDDPTMKDFFRSLAEKGPVPETFSSFQQMVLAHYARAGRDMAWRHTTDPYKILVSEIMLQQTQVERVTVKFPEFIEAFPDFATLSTAPLHEILAVWQGMGYNRRAIALKKIAQKVMVEYGGTLPRDVETLANFPGIGKATAGSIAAFAFNMPALFIETNIRRVFIHFFFNGKESVNDNEILPLVDHVLYRKNPRKWYWALMDAGAALKKAVFNPNIKSVHYTKQTAFKGSDRMIRGMVLKLLLDEPAVSEEDVIKRMNVDLFRVQRIITALERDGFIKRRDNHLVLSE